MKFAYLTLHLHLRVRIECKLQYIIPVIGHKSTKPGNLYIHLNCRIWV